MQFPVSFCLSAITQVIYRNGLNVLFVENKELKKSAVAFTVNFTSYDNKIPGLTSLLMHTLFLSCEEDPQTDFDNFVRMHEGKLEINISYFVSALYFEINSEHLENALEKLLYKIKNPKIELERLKILINYFDDKLNEIKNVESYIFKRFFDSCTNNYKDFNFGTSKTLNISDIEKNTKDHFLKFIVPKNMKLIIYHSNDEILNFIRLNYGILQNDFKLDISNNLLENLQSIQRFDPVYNNESYGTENFDTERIYQNGKLLDDRLNDSKNSYCERIYENYSIFNDTNLQNIESNAPNDSDNYQNTNSNQFFDTEYANTEHKILKKYAFNENIYKKNLFTKDLLGKFLHLEIYSKAKKLAVCIEIPKKQNIFADGSINYIKKLLLSRSKNSLIDILLLKNLVFEVQIDDKIELDHSFIIFDINLTNDGYRNIPNVIYTMQLYIEKLEYSKRDFDIKNEKIILENAFNNYMSQFELIKLLENSYRYYPLENLLNHDIIFNRYNEDEIIAIIEILKDCKNWLIVIISDSLEEQCNFVYDFNLVCSKQILNFDVEQKHYSPKLFKILKDETFDFKYYIGNMFTFSDNLYSTENSNIQYSLKYVHSNQFYVPKTYVSITFTDGLSKENYISTVFLLFLAKATLIREEIGILELNDIKIKIICTSFCIKIIFFGNLCCFNTLINKFFNYIKYPDMQLFILVKNEIYYSFLEKTDLFEMNLEEEILKEELNLYTFNLEKLSNDIKFLTIGELKFTQNFHLDLFVSSCYDLINFNILAKTLISNFTFKQKHDFFTKLPTNFNKINKKTQKKINWVCFDCGKTDDVIDFTNFQIQNQLFNQFYKLEYKTDFDNNSWIKIKKIHVFDKILLILSTKLKNNEGGKTFNIRNFIQKYDSFLENLSETDLNESLNHAKENYNIEIDNKFDLYKFDQFNYLANTNDLIKKKYFNGSNIIIAKDKLSLLKKKILHFKKKYI
ncbi:hypothetical protein GVAV_000716 [Gurleya vavrai]